MIDYSQPLGLYIHIPFCASRCVYCDFYSTTAAPRRMAYVEAVGRELATYNIMYARTLYIGGGTPSQLAPRELARLFALIRQRVRLAEDAEVTIEANPDDVTPEWIEALRQTPVNRVSLGLQTFDDDLLRLLRRRHTAREAREAVRRLQAAGYTNLSVDLIYGLPGQTLTTWERDLDEALALRVPHLSAYALMVEEGTPLHRMVERGEVSVADEELSLAMYRRLTARLGAAGYEHYEVSNFALTGRRARHNSAYWTLRPYIGLGPGAHSYDGAALRWWNRPALDAYLRGETLREQETLTLDQRYEERLFLALRTREGIDLAALRRDFTPPRVAALLAKARPWIEGGRLALADDHLRLTPDGVFVMDTITVELI